MKNKWILPLALVAITTSVFTTELHADPKPFGYFFGPVDTSGGQIEPNLSLADLEYLFAQPGDSCGPNDEYVYIVNSNGDLVCAPKWVQPEVPMSSFEWFRQTMRELEKSKTRGN